MDDELCVECGRKWQEQNLGGVRLKTNAPKNEWCWHRFCTSCIERKMLRQQKFACKLCGSVVRKSTLDSREREEIEAERDVLARRRVLAVYNKPRRAFGSDREYYDYLEQVEDMVEGLSRGGAAAKQVEQTLKRYQTEHAADVARRASEKADKERLAALEVKAAEALAAASAQRQRDEERRLKLDQQLYEKRKLEYELGDRPDMPTPPEKKHHVTADDYPLPAPVEAVPDRPKIAKGKELEARRTAADWTPDAFRARAYLELFQGLGGVPDKFRGRAIYYAPKVQVVPSTT